MNISLRPSAGSGQDTLRGLYQQALLLAWSNPFHLAEGECPAACSARWHLSPTWPAYFALDEEEDCEGAMVDLSAAQPCSPFEQPPQGDPSHLRRFELGALLVALHEPAPKLQSEQQQQLEQVRQHWLGRQQRRHTRSEFEGACDLIIGYPPSTPNYWKKRPSHCPATMLDASPGRRAPAVQQRSGHPPDRWPSQDLLVNSTPSPALRVLETRTPKACTWGCVT